MAQAEKRNASNKSNIFFQTEAPEVSRLQVLVKEPEKKKDESQSLKKKLRKIFSKVSLNAKITEEVKCINDVKAKLDTKLLGYRNNLINF